MVANGLFNIPWPTATTLPGERGRCGRPPASSPAARAGPQSSLMSEARLTPVSARRTTLAARSLAKAQALPTEDLLCRVADAAVTPRLISVTGWRSVGGEVWRAAGIVAPIEQVEPALDAPWSEITSVEFNLEADSHIPRVLRRR